MIPPPVERRDAGFTLVELLVVVLVIGILTAIAVPVYQAVQGTAKDAAVKSDLISAKTALVAVAGRYGESPSAVSPSGVATVAGSSVPLGQFGWSLSGSTASLGYAVAGDRWCVDGAGVTGSAFRVSSSTRVAAGTCAALGTSGW